MPHDFHIGNQKSRVAVSDPGIPIFQDGNYNGGMDQIIGTRHPSQLFIKEWIAERGLEQEEVAARMGRAPPTLSKLLNGKMGMTTAYLAEIADALDVSVRDLFRDPKDDPSKPISLQDRRAANLFSRLQGPGKDHILGLLEQLLPPEEPKPSDGQDRPADPKPSENG
jgi:transcriptional regulator with XRE-family HTH domain